MCPISSIAAHLSTHGYHPRSNKHSNFLCEAILDDLLAGCKAIAKHAAAGEIVADLNFKIAVGATDWNIDLVIGEASGVQSPPPDGFRIKRERPSLIRIGVEAKSVMTEHRKASRNRQRDLAAFHEHLHHYSDDAIAAGVVLLNISQSFFSPLRNSTVRCPKCAHTFSPTSATLHKGPEDLVEFGVELFRNLPVRAATQSIGLDAVGVIVVDHSNAPASKATIWEVPPAPKVGDPLHYNHFIQKICQLYTKRFAS